MIHNTTMLTVYGGCPGSSCTFTVSERGEPRRYPHEKKCTLHNDRFTVAKLHVHTNAQTIRETCGRAIIFHGSQNPKPVPASDGVPVQPCSNSSPRATSLLWSQNAEADNTRVVQNWASFRQGDKRPSGFRSQREPDAERQTERGKDNGRIIPVEKNQSASF